jgi:sucrose phosphorylase
VWTTFSNDQIDLNFANPLVLFEIIDLLLFYVGQGAEIIRLDAIAYLWKEIGTSCIHLPETHQVVKLFRAVLDEVAPGVILITETNVPHAENVSYFGQPLRDEDVQPTMRGDEAQMVYQFPLAPLVLHTFHNGDASVLTEWAANLNTPYPTATFFNFIASHDGIGVRPAEGLLSPEEVQYLVERTLAHGGQVSYKLNPDGSQSAYELNITLYDALNDPSNPDLETDVQRFLASQALMLSLAGVPGIYIHSLFGSRNCQTCFQTTGRARSINREKFNKAELEQALADSQSRESRVLYGYTQLLQARRAHPAFHPFAPQVILDLDTSVFALLRFDLEGNEHILSLINVTNREQELDIDLAHWDLTGYKRWRDLVTGIEYEADQLNFSSRLNPYQYAWFLPV